MELVVVPPELEETLEDFLAGGKSGKIELELKDGRVLAITSTIALNRKVLTGRNSKPIMQS